MLMNHRGCRVLRPPDPLCAACCDRSCTPIPLHTALVARADSRPRHSSVLSAPSVPKTKDPCARRRQRRKNPPRPPIRTHTSTRSASRSQTPRSSSWSWGFRTRPNAAASRTSPPSMRPKMIRRCGGETQRRAGA
jgi:hypothetical protein